MTLTRHPRPAYTLLELLVAVGLIVVLATLTIAVANSSLVDSYRIVGGADRVSGWLLNAKNRALRDRTPVGIQLIRNSANPADPEFHYVRSAQLVEMPVLYAPVQEPDQNAVPTSSPFICVRYADQRVTVNGTPVNALIQDSNANANDPIGVFLYWPNNVSPYPTFTPNVDLSPGDLLKINELNTLHRITAITAVNQPSFYTALNKPVALAAGQWYKLTLATGQIRLESSPLAQNFPISPPNPSNLLPLNFPHSVSGTPPTINYAGTTQTYPAGYPPIGGANYMETNYFGLYKSARPVLGEPILQLPANMAIDIFPGQDNGTAGLSAADILAPSRVGNVALSQALANPAGDINIMFNPNGSVMFTELNPVLLWLRDTRNGGGQEPMLVTNVVRQPVTNAVLAVDVDRPRLMNSGEHVLVSINSKTGAIATYPINPPDPTGRYPVTEGNEQAPYRYAKRSTNTGL